MAAISLLWLTRTSQIWKGEESEQFEWMGELGNQLIIKNLSLFLILVCKW